MNGRGIQTLIAAILLIVEELAIWMQNRKEQNPKKE
jgi:hypothetical protein